MHQSPLSIQIRVVAFLIMPLIRRIHVFAGVLSRQESLFQRT